MAWSLRITLAVLVAVLSHADRGISADARTVSPRPDATLTFPDLSPDAAWGTSQFWPMARAYAWAVEPLPEGTYRMVVRAASAKAVQGKRKIGADEAETEFSSIGGGLRVDGASGSQAFQRGFVAVQLIDLGDLGIDAPSPLRIRAVFTVKS